MAHLDVVPVEGDWQHDAFSGDVVDGQIWGRGTLDDKGCLVGICEAVETLLERDVTPAQDVWLSFGCDEEVFGTAAIQAVDELRTPRGPAVVRRRRGRRDRARRVHGRRQADRRGRGDREGRSCRSCSASRVAAATPPPRPGWGRPPGWPARSPGVDRSPMPSSLPAPTVELFRRLAPHAPLALRPLMANAARLGPVLPKLLTALGPESAAMARTTFAITTLQGSPALNVIAQTATAGRQHPDHARRHLRDRARPPAQGDRRRPGRDRRRRGLRAQPAVAVLDRRRQDEAFELIEATISEVFPDAVPAPYVMMAATDSRTFAEICDRVYRFAPFRMTKAQREAIHSYDEHLGVDDFLDGVRWYQRLIERLPA